MQLGRAVTVPTTPQQKLRKPQQSGVASPCVALLGRLTSGHASPAAWPTMRRVVLPLAAAAKEAATNGSTFASEEEEEDLWQFPDRQNWYLPKFAAEDQPDWQPARFVHSTQLGPGVREVVVEVEVDRERVPLRNAYRHVGQSASMRVNSGEDRVVSVSTPPFPQSLLRESLWRVRGDLFAGETKVAREPGSTLGQVALLVREEDGMPDIYNMQEDDLLECGPFTGSGLDLRGPIIGIFNYPTVVIFCEGDGIAVAKSLIEATPDVGGLNFPLRSNVHMYYRATNEQQLLYRHLFEQWEQEKGVKVMTATRDSFMDMFDDDDTLVYEPATTAAIILTGGLKEDEEAAMEVCKEAEISVVVRQSAPQTPSRYITKGRPDDDE